MRRIEAWSAAVAAAEERFGKLDVLVNNAGVPSICPGRKLDHWDEVIALNQTGAFLGMREAIPALRRAGGGSIVNMSSTWGVAGQAITFAYQASNGGVLAMTRSADALKVMAASSPEALALATTT